MERRSLDEIFAEQPKQAPRQSLEQIFGATALKQEAAPQPQPQPQQVLGRQALGMQPQQLEAAGRAALRGATFGFEKQITPYIAAGVAKMAGVKEPYKELVKESKEIEKQRRKTLKGKYPKTTVVSEIAGGVLSPVNVVGMKASQAVGGGLLGAMTGASVEGAIAGLGYTEDITDAQKATEDMIKTGIISGITGGTLYGVGKGIAALSPIITKPIQRFTSQRKAAAKGIKKILRKEGVDATRALQRMTDEGLELIDVVDPRSAIVSSLPEKSYEKATIDLVDDYAKRLNKAGNKAKNEILDMISKNKITEQEGAELIGKNAQEVINRQLKIRTAKAKPLYDRAFKSKKAANIISENDELLTRPVVQDAIEKVREESEKFGETAVGSLEKLKDNSLPVLHQAKDYLYRKSKDFTDLENMRYKQVYAELSDRLKKASPDYKKATEIWAGETEGIEQLYKQKGIGNIAKKYANNDLDGIRGSFKNIFTKQVSLQEVERLKRTMNPEEFSAIVRKDLGNAIEDAGEKGSILKIALFGKGEDVGLKNKKLDLIFTKNEKLGLRKTVDLIDRARIRGKEISKIKFARPAVQEARFVSYNKMRMLANAVNRIKESPQYREEFIRYITTPEGKKLLTEISKAKGLNANNLLFNLLGGLETQINTEER